MSVNGQSSTFPSTPPRPSHPSQTPRGSFIRNAKGAPETGSLVPPNKGTITPRGSITQSRSARGSLIGTGDMIAPPPTAHRPNLRRKLTYSADDQTHPHNDPQYLAADDEDAAANGVSQPYGMFMMWALFVNYVIDTGALGLPYAFVQSGWVLSIITLIASGVMSTITVLFTLEAMARTTGILEWKERQEKRWRRRRKKPHIQAAELDTISDEDDLDEYQQGEIDEEKEVLQALGESLRVNRAINPSAKLYGSFLGSSPTETPLFSPSPSGSSANLQERFDASLNGALPARHIQSRSVEVAPVAGADPPALSLDVEKGTAPRTPSPRGSILAASSPSGHAHSHTAAVAAVAGGRSGSGNHLTTGSGNPGLPHEQTPLVHGSQGYSSTHSSPRINPLASGRGYPITSPAHDPEHVHQLLHNKPIHHLSYRRTDFTLMSQMFGGWPLSVLTQLSVTLFSYVSLWVTAAIFAQSCDTLFFQYYYDQECNIYNANQSTACYNGYYIIVGLYSLLVLYLSLQDIAETATTQAVLTGYRFAAFAAMGITCLVATFHPNYFGSPDGRHPATWNPLNSAQAQFIPEVNWPKFDAIFTIATVSLMVQYNIPDIVQPMRTPYKRHANGVVAVTLGAMVACVALYMSLALICALTIGQNTFPLVTLNWSHYTGLDGGWGLLPKGGSISWWAQCIKLFIMLFPVISMISCFPLIAISLSENLRSSIPTKIASNYSPEAQKTFCRLAACIPPLILTCLSGQVDLIFMVAGFVAFLIQLIIPCLLQWTSIRYCKRIWGPGSEKTPFSFGILSHPITVGLVFLISCGIAGYSVVAQFNGGGDDDAAAADASGTAASPAT